VVSDDPGLGSLDGISNCTASWDTHPPPLPAVLERTGSVLIGTRFFGWRIVQQLDNGR
jgi:hypothetical protein